MSQETTAEHSVGDTVVSVIIPFCAEYTPDEMLTEAIESAENQQGVETEIHIIEDKEQRGPAWARNVGLERADTRYVAFLDADDIWKETKLRDQLQLMHETGAGMCVDGEREYTPIEFVGALMTGETFGLTSAITIDTEQVDARFDESLPRREDHLYMIEAAMQGGVCTLPETFLDRTHEDGFSHYVDNSPQDIDEFYDAVVAVTPEASRFKNKYYRQSYTYLGRMRHFDRQYRVAIGHYLESLKYGPSVDAIGALGITLLTILYEIPLRSARRLWAGGTYE